MRQAELILTQEDLLLIFNLVNKEIETVNAKTSTSEAEAKEQLAYLESLGKILYAFNWSN